MRFLQKTSGHLDLVTFREQPADPGGICDAFRWSFSIWWLGFGFFWQYRLKEDSSWHCHHTNLWVLSMTTHFRWGSEHFWYDGSHCMYSWGFVHLLWTNRNCSKCQSTI